MGLPDGAEGAAGALPLTPSVGAPIRKPGGELFEVGGAFIEPPDAGANGAAGAVSAFEESRLILEGAVFSAAAPLADGGGFSALLFFNEELNFSNIPEASGCYGKNLNSF